MSALNLPQAYELAMDHHRAGRFADAEAIYRQMLSVRQDIVEVHNNLGIALAEQGRHKEAIQAYRQAIRLRPNFVEALNNLGNTLRQRGDVSEAIQMLSQAVANAPQFATAFENLGLAYEDAFQPDLALGAYRRLVELRPDDPAAHFNLANVLRDLSQIDAAIESYQAAITLRPGYVEAHHNLAGVLKDAGRLDDALSEFARAMELGPNTFTARNVLCTIHFHPDYTARRLADAHAEWNRQYAQALAPVSPHFANVPDPGRRLKIGYVSPDFREHPVGRFMLPLLSHHDRKQFEIYCYTDARRVDALTEKLKTHTNIWQSTSSLSDEHLSDLVRRDQIDILVDLTMHMKGSRLLAFARKPAPVQITYLAYCSTTGLKAIDYRLSDPWLDPAGMDESVYSEKTIRLPRTYWCYPPPDGAPDLTPPPSANTGQVTFGCLNNYCKVTGIILSLWRDLLAAVPRSRLILHALEGKHRQDALNYFAAGGVASDRIEFVGQLPLKDYLDQYNRIDIALDPFPYGGGTTTCDALYMGVPVVSLSGDTAVSRGGLSILSNLSHRELVASSPEEYLQIAQSLAADPSRLAELRRTLRNQMQSSVLMDAPSFARDVEAAFRGAWANWCATQSV